MAYLCRNRCQGAPSTPVPWPPTPVISGGPIAMLLGVPNNIAGTALIGLAFRLAGDMGLSGLQPELRTSRVGSDDSQ